MRKFQHAALLDGWMKPNFLRELNQLIGKIIDLPMDTYRYGNSGTMDCVPVSEYRRTSDGYHWPVAIQLRDSSAGGMVLIVLPAVVDDDRAPAYYFDKYVTPEAAKLIVQEVVTLLTGE